MNEYSKEAMMVLEELSDKDIKQLQKGNPFRYERNTKIKDLCGRGVMQVILAEISGLSATSISRISQTIKKQKDGDHVLP